MSNEIKATRALAPVMAWLVPAAVTGVVAAAVISYSGSEETQAAPDSPYYDKAVKEALVGLTNLGAKAAAPAGRPPLPAGLSPDEHYWCEQHQVYHKRQPGQAPPAAGATPPADAGGAPAPLAVPPAAPPAAQPAGAIPPLGAGLAAADYYWCPNCKIYHKREPVPGQAADAAHPPAVAGPPAAQQAAQAAGTIPPLPAGLSPNDYYWCPNCKVYHVRQAAEPKPEAWRGIPFRFNPPPASPAAPQPGTRP